MLGDWAGEEPGEIPVGSSADRNFFHTILADIGDDVLVVDPKFQVCFANRCFIDKVQLSPEEVLQSTCFRLLFGRASPCPDEDCLVRNVLNTRGSCDKVYSFPSHKRFSQYVEARGYPSRDRSGNISHIVILRRDATEAMSLRQRLAELNDIERRKAQEASALVRVSRAVGGTLDLKAILKIIGEQATELLQADRCAVLLLDESGNTLSASFAMARDEQEVSERRAARIPVGVDRIWRFVLDHRKVIALDRVVTQKIGKDSPDVEVKSVLVAPLVAKNKPLGILYADVTSREHVWSEEDKVMAAALADQAALAIDNAKAYSTVKEKVAQVQVINEVAQAVSASLNLNEIVQRAAEYVRKVVSFDRASVFLVGESKDDWRTFRIGEATTSKLTEGTKWLRDDTTPAWVASNRRAWIDEDIAKWSRFPEDRILLEEGVRSKIVVPLISNNVVVGTLNLGSSKPGTYSERDLDVLLPIAAQIAPAIANARLFETATRSNRELSALHSVAAAVSGSLEIEDIANSCLDAVAEVFEWDGLALVVWGTSKDAPTLRIFRGSCRGLPAALAEAENSPMIMQAFHSGAKLVVNDISEHPQWAYLCDKAKSKSVINLPVKHKDEVFGLLCLVGSGQERFRQEDVKLLEAICNQIGIGIARSRLYSEVNRRASEFRALLELGKDISASLDLDLILKSAVEHARLLLGSDVSFLCLTSPSGEEMKVAMEAGTTTDKMRDFAVAIGEYSSAFDVPFVVDDVSCAEFIDPKLSQVLNEEGLRSMLTVPLLMDGELLGVLHVANREKTKFSDDDVTLLAAFANQAAIAIRNAQLHKEVKQLAVTDGLTSLHNHRYFYQRLTEEFDRAMRFKRPLSVIFIDVDDLKAINDSYGHIQGDAVLREMGGLVKSTVRTTDIVARYGGDELAVILPETTTEEAVMIGHRLQEKIRAHDFLGAAKAKVTISLGIASLDDRVGGALDLVRCADVATYKAKMLGKSRLYVFADADD